MFTLALDDDTLTPVAESYAHMATARRVAASQAAAHGIAVLVLVNGSPRLRIMPQGTATPPPGAQVASGPECRIGQPGACFCANCRAARR